MRGYCLSNQSDKFLEVQKVRETFNLLHDDQTLLAPFSDHREGGAAAGSQGRMALLDGPFDILRIVVPSPDNDEVFQTTGDIQLTTLNKPQIAGS